MTGVPGRSLLLSWSRADRLQAMVLKHSVQPLGCMLLWLLVVLGGCQAFTSLNRFAALPQQHSAVGSALAAVVQPAQVTNLGLASASLPVVLVLLPAPLYNVRAPRLVHVPSPCSVDLSRRSAQHRRQASFQPHNLHIKYHRSQKVLGSKTCATRAGCNEPTQQQQHTCHSVFVDWCLAANTIRLPSCWLGFYARCSCTACMAVQCAGSSYRGRLPALLFFRRPGSSFPPANTACAAGCRVADDRRSSALSAPSVL